MSKASVSVKVHYDDTEIRRFSCTGYQDFLEKVKKFSPHENHEKLELKYSYLDEEKDYVIFESVGEWEEGIEHHFGKVMKIKVELKKENKKEKERKRSEEKGVDYYPKSEEVLEEPEFYEYPHHNWEEEGEEPSFFKANEEEEGEEPPFFNHHQRMFGGRGRGCGRGMGMCGRGGRHGWGMNMGNGRGRGHGFGFGGRGGRGFGMRGHGRGMWKREFHEGEEFVPGHIERERCNWMDVPPKKIGVFRKIGRCRKQIAAIEFKLEKIILNHQEKMSKVEEKINFLLENSKPGKEKEFNEKVMKLKTKLFGIENSLKKKTESLNSKKREWVEKMEKLMQRMKEEVHEEKEKELKEKEVIIIGEPKEPETNNDDVYPQQFQVLKEMGFEDEKAVKKALNETKGNVVEAVKIIMNLQKN